MISTYRPEQTTIVVGNLALGGTGKTPFIDFLASRLDNHSTAILSRGYGRKSTGTLLVDPSMTADECGDEPLQLKKRHPDMTVLVEKDRAAGLEHLKKTAPQVKVVLLDDAFQHRRVKGDLNLLLTTYQKPFFSDHLLPVGNLRDLKSRVAAADAIIVTKSPPGLTEAEKEDFSRRLKGKKDASILFSHIVYDKPVPMRPETETPLNEGDRVILLSGIANPELFAEQARKRYRVERHFKFPDHHRFNSDDLMKLRDFIDTFEGRNPAVLTTEKDAMRLEIFRSQFEKLHIDFWYWPIHVDFGEETDSFESMINRYV